MEDEIKNYLTSLTNRIEWYEQKCKKYKNLFYVLCSLEIILSASIPFLAGVLDSNNQISKMLIGVFGVAISIISGFTAFFKFRDQWISYRRTIEILKKERNLFVTGAGIYAFNSEDRFIKFVECIENVIFKENDDWCQSAKERKVGNSNV